MSTQLDRPDFVGSRQTTDDPLLNIQQAVNVTPYDSGVLDVGQYTRIHVAAISNSLVDTFKLQVIFTPDSGGVNLPFTDNVTLNLNGTWFNADYPTVTRYVRFKITSLGGTTDTVQLIVTPSSGPSSLFTFNQFAPAPTNTLVGAGNTLTYDPILISRGLWRLYAYSRCPQWTLLLKARDINAGSTTILTLTNGDATLPVDVTLRPELSSLFATFTNNWLYSVRVFLYLTPVTA